MSSTLAFTNGYICYGGTLLEKTLWVDIKSGLIIDQPEDGQNHDVYDLQGEILAPAFLELQTNGCAGFHFTQFTEPDYYEYRLFKVSRYLLSTGVGGFWATIPTVSSKVFKDVLPLLKPQAFPGGAELLGAHCEGPFLNPSKKGAHDSTLMKHPGIMVEQGVYGAENLRSSIKMITVAPELVGSKGLIKSLSEDYNIVVSLGHSAADIDTGLKALSTGAKALTHVFNAMNPLNHRAPGLVGLIASPQAPYFSIIPDGIHLHPTTVSMAYRANPEKCILITDSLEMAGMPDGLYPGHAQVPHKQRKIGNKVTIDGTDTLIGSCISVDECVRNLQEYSSCTLASAVRCVTENVANLMGLQDRGILSSGRRADLVALDSRGYVQKVWIKGQEVFQKKIEQTCPRDE